MDYIHNRYLWNYKKFIYRV